MVLLQLSLVILLCSVALGWVARRFHFPYPIALVIGGGVLGFVPKLPELPFNPATATAATGSEKQGCRDATDNGGSPATDGNGHSVSLEPI